MRARRTVTGPSSASGWPSLIPSGRRRAIITTVICSVVQLHVSAGSARKTYTPVVSDDGLHFGSGSYAADTSRGINTPVAGALPGPLSVTAIPVAGRRFAFGVASIDATVLISQARAPESPPRSPKATQVPPTAELGYVTPSDFGATGDGTYHKAREWCSNHGGTRYHVTDDSSCLSAIQAEYADVSDIGRDSADWLAIMGAYRYAFSHHVPAVRFTKTGDYVISKQLRSTHSVNMDFGNSTITLSAQNQYPDNIFLMWSSRIDRTYDFSGAYNQGGQSLTLSSTASLHRGQPIEIDGALNPRTSDPTLVHFAVITNIAGTLVMFSPGLPESVAGAHRLYTFAGNELVENISVSDVRVSYSDGIRAAGGLVFSRLRNVRVTNVSSVRNSGALILAEYCDNFYADSVNSGQSRYIGGTSTGFGIHLFTIRNAYFGSVWLRRVDKYGLYVEGNTRDVTFNKLYIETDSTRPPGVPLVAVIEHSKGVLIHELTVSTAKAETVQTVQPDCEFSIEDLRLYREPLYVNLGYMETSGSVDYVGHRYNSGNYQRFATTVPLTHGAGTVSVDLPSGVYRRVRVYADSVAGISAVNALRVSGDGQMKAEVSLLTRLHSGAIYEDGGLLTSLGSSYPFNDAAGNDEKKLQITTTAGLRPGTYLRLEIEYWATVRRDASDIKDTGGTAQSAAGAVVLGGEASSLAPGVGAVLSAGRTVRPTNAIHHVSGTGEIDNILTPRGALPGESVILISDGLFTTTSSGNIGARVAVPAGRAMVFVWDGLRWYPSY